MRGGKADHYSDGSVDTDQGSAMSKRLKKIANIFSKNKKKTPIDEKSGSKKKDKNARELRDLPPLPIKPTIKPTEEATDDKSQKQSKSVVLESHYYEAEADDETGTDDYEDCNYSAPAALGSVNHSPPTGQPRMESPAMVSSPEESPRNEALRMVLPEDSPNVSPRMASSLKESLNEDNESFGRQVIPPPMGTGPPVEIQETASSASGEHQREPENFFLDILNFLPGCADKFDERSYESSYFCRPGPDLAYGDSPEDLKDDIKEADSLAADELGEVREADTPMMSPLKQNNFFCACLSIQETLSKAAACGSAVVGVADFNDASSVLADDLDKLDSANRDQVDGPLPLDLDKLYIAPKDEAPAAIDIGTAEAGDALDANAKTTPATKADVETTSTNSTRGVKHGPEAAGLAPDVDKEAATVTGSINRGPEESRAGTAPGVDEEAATATVGINNGPEESRAEASAALDVQDAVVDTQEDFPDADGDIQGVFALSKQPTPSGITNDENSAVSAEAAKEKKTNKVKDVVQAGIAVIELANAAVASRLTGMEPRDAPPQAEPWKKETPWTGSRKERKMSRSQAQQREMERLKIKRRHHKNVQQKRGKDEIERARLRDENASLSGASRQSSFDLLTKSFDSIKTEKSTLDALIQDALERIERARDFVEVNLMPSASATE